MNFAIAILSFLSSASHTGFCLPADPASNYSGDSLTLLVRLEYPGAFPDDLRKSSFFMEQLASDFKQRGKKEHKYFQLLREADSSVHYDLVLRFSFYAFTVGDEKSDQSMRLATMKKMETVFDRDAEQHKRQDVDYTADVTHIKRSVDCSISVIMTISRPGDDPAIFDKVFNEKYTWENEYLTFKGDQEALSKDELQLSRNRRQDTPSQKNLYKELLRICYKDVAAEFDSFFKEKKGF
jgi:hypothetical protein